MSKSKYLVHPPYDPYEPVSHLILGRAVLKRSSSATFLSQPPSPIKLSLISALIPRGVSDGKSTLVLYSSETEAHKSNSKMYFIRSCLISYYHYPSSCTPTFQLEISCGQGLNIHDSIHWWAKAICSSSDTTQFLLNNLQITSISPLPWTLVLSLSLPCSHIANHFNKGSLNFSDFCIFYSGHNYVKLQ